ncbi:MAG: universal stress protein [Alphaproteobacteria bacterium]|nr:universal stress protein [Alphaproteobacteria bacterium]
MRNILMASDLSSRSDRAFDRAVQVSKQFKAGLHVLHVLDPDLPMQIQDELLDNAEKTLKAQAGRAQKKVSAAAEKKSAGKKSAGKKDAVVVAAGSPAQTILEQSKKLKADLIVTGAHKKDSLRDLFIKSTAEKLLRFSEKPVLVVKNPVKGEYKKIVVGMDFSDHALKALYTALTMFPAAAVHVVHAYSLPFRGLVKDRDLEAFTLDQRKEGMDKVLAALGRKLGKGKAKAFARMKVVMKDDQPSASIHAEVRKMGADMVIIGTHGKSDILTGIVGSVARDMIHNSKADVLVVN